MKTILLKLAGPLQSWGTKSHFEKRHTDLYPSKSALIGMVAASFGYRRKEDEKIQQLNQLEFAVRVDQPGHIMTDFQTARKNDKPAPYVTYREYLEDAVFVVALGSKNDDFIAEVEEALKNPYFAPGLGRRSAPLTMDSFMGTLNSDVITALKKIPWQASKWYQWKNKNYAKMVPVYADSILVGDQDGVRRKDAVISFSNQGRRYAYRMESRIIVDLHKEEKDDSQEHDAFGALGD